MNYVINKEFFFKDWGQLDYNSGWAIQTQYFNDSIHKKIQNRSLAQTDQSAIPNYLFFVEHPPVFTLGKSGKKEHLLSDESILNQKQATFVETNRGGDITFHGPGQLVAYPIFDLENFFTDIHLYMRTLEEVVILTLADFGITAGRYPGYTGVWLDPETPALARKICAMGVKTSRWVTMHGLALNVCPDLSYFQMIVPCGINDKQVTSMAKELGRDVSLSEVQHSMLQHFIQQFELTPAQTPLPLV